MLGYGRHLFRRDAVPHNVLVVATIFVVVLLLLPARWQKEKAPADNRGSSSDR
jgi:hypothetical protein